MAKNCAYPFGGRRPRTNFFKSIDDPLRVSVLSFYGLSWLGQLLQQIMNSTTNTVLQMSAVFISLGVLLLQGIFILNILLSFLRKKRILFYEKASHTYTVSTIGQTKDDDSRN